MDQTARRRTGILGYARLEAAAVGTVCCEAPQALCGALRLATSPGSPLSECWKTRSSRVGAAQPHPRTTLACRAARPPRPRPASGRTRNLLHRPGTRARCDLFVRPCRADQHDKGCHGGVGGRQIARGPRRISSRPGAAGLCRSHGKSSSRGWRLTWSSRCIAAAPSSSRRCIARCPTRLVTANIGSHFTLGV
jgi:hypothetical protein